jgi:hypothetical protein
LVTLDKIKQFTKVQFLHWTEEEFSSCFRKMLTLEQYREPQMAQLYQNYLASGPLIYMETLFSEMLGDAGKASQHLIFMDLFFYFTAYMMEQKTRAM